MSSPTITIDIAFASDPFDTTQTWTSVAAYAEAFSTRSGRRSEFDRFAPGSATVVLDNADRRFDPTHDAGPYYPDVVPMRRVRIRARYPGNQAQNPGFESGTTGWAASAGTLTTNGTSPHAGALRGLLTATSTGTIQLTSTGSPSYRIPVTAGEGYTLTFYAIQVGANARNIRALINWEDSGGSAISMATGSNTAVGTSWTAVTVSGTAPVGATQCYVQGQILAAAVGDSYAFDDFDLVGANEVYDVFHGFAEDWPQSYALNGRVEPVALAATDVLGMLAGLNVRQPFIELDDKVAGVIDRGFVAGPSSVIAETTGDRIDRLLDIIDWPAGERSIDTGHTTLPAGQPKGPALSYCQAVEETENGRFFAGPDGSIIFRDRHAPFTRTEMAVSQVDISDDVDESDAAYSHLEPRYERAQIRNHVQVRLTNPARDADGEVEFSDEDSVDRYGLHTYSRSTMLDNPDEALAFAQYIVAVYKDPMMRFEQVRIAAHVDPELLYPIVLGRQIGDRITITRRPDIGDPIVVECHIEGVDHQVGKDGSWYTTWTLSPADTQNYLILDDAARGLVGTDLIGY